MRQEALATLNGKTVTTMTALTQLMRLHQITCGHFSADDGTIQEVKNNRLAELLDVLDVERFNKLGFKDLRPYNIHVQAMDNTAQGVKTVGDLLILDEFGTLKNYTKENK